MILCCGEALIDMIPEPTVSGAQGFVPHPGGAVFNTAIALGRLGAGVGLLSGLSRDLFGQNLRAALAASGVADDLVIDSDRPSTLAFVQLVEGQARYSFFDENSAGRMLVPADLPRLPARVSALFFGGISLACEPGADAYAALLAREGAGRAVMIDPNIRPGFIRDPGRYRARLTGMLAAAQIVKVSDEDLDWLVPGAGGVVEKARALRAAGPALVIVTRGAAGALALGPGEALVEVAARRVEVVDTVGAGDTFNAGVLHCFDQRGVLRAEAIAQLAPEDIRAALEFGARVAAVTVTRAGANPPWASEL